MTNNLDHLFVIGIAMVAAALALDISAGGLDDYRIRDVAKVVTIALAVVGAALVFRWVMG